MQNRPKPITDPKTLEVYYEGYPRGWADPEDEMSDATREMVLRGNAIAWEREAKEKASAGVKSSTPAAERKEPFEDMTDRAAVLEAYSAWQALLRALVRAQQALDRVPTTSEVTAFMRALDDMLDHAANQRTKYGYHARKAARAAIDAPTYEEDDMLNPGEQP